MWNRIKQACFYVLAILIGGGIGWWVGGQYAREILARILAVKE